MNQRLKAPFPYAGGKGRWAGEIWGRFGKVTGYVEPFAGSLAVLLASPHGAAEREVVCDMSANIANFWRSIQADPDAVAFHADFPTDHMTLHATNVWLLKWNEEHHDRLWEDREFHDPKAAGRWAWGCSNWIGGAFAETSRMKVNGDAWDARPHVTAGQGVQQQVPDKVPNLERGLNGIPMVRHFSTNGNPTGSGVQMQVRQSMDGVPVVQGQGHGTARGVQMQRREFPIEGEAEAMPLDGSRLRPWMRALCDRLLKVIVLHRSWESAVTPTMLLGHSDKPLPVGILLDPPYRTDEGNRKGDLYGSDKAGTSTDAATASYEWAVKAAVETRLRIAYCCRSGDFAVPDGWTSNVRDFSGVRDADRRAVHKDEIMYSPGCLKDPEEGLPVQEGLL